MAGLSPLCLKYLYQRQSFFLGIIYQSHNLKTSVKPFIILGLKESFDCLYVLKPSQLSIQILMNRFEQIA